MNHEGADSQGKSVGKSNGEDSVSLGRNPPERWIQQTFSGPQSLGFEPLRWIEEEWLSCPLPGSAGCILLQQP